MIPADFHFLRPHWLYALVPALMLAMAAWHRLGIARTEWAGLVDRHLLRHLMVRGGGGTGRWPALALLLAWSLAAVAMAGPAWRKSPTPALDQMDPVVVVFSLARTMDQTDVRPSRLAAARHKVEDLLARMRGGQVGLVIYADAPFVAAPLTEDGRIVSLMLSEVSTDLMPEPGDRPDLALAQAAALLRNTGARSGRILLVTDSPGMSPLLTQNAASAAAAEGYEVSVLGVTPTGSDESGTPLSALAAAGGGNFAKISPDGRDLDAVLARAHAGTQANPTVARDLEADQWVDMGSWLLLAVIPLAALAFRRGWLAVALLVLVFGAADMARPVQAQGTMTQDVMTRDVMAQTSSSMPPWWDDLWRTPDQQGARAFSDRDYATASQRFENPAWKASAFYESGDYGAAARMFSAIPGAEYNLGNALARAGNLEAALSAYDAALARDPNHADAAHNREIVKRILDLRKAQTAPPRDQSASAGGQNQQSKPQNSEGSGDRKPQDAQNSATNPDQPQQKPGTSGQADQTRQKDASRQNKSGPDKQAQQKPGQDKTNQDKQSQDKPAQDKPAQDKPAQDKPGQDKPTQSNPAQAPKDPSKADPSQAQAKPDDAGHAQPPAQQQLPPAGMTPQTARAMSEQDQNREQALRSVPDDPVGLLRARIRSYYSKTVVPAFQDQRP